MRAFLFYIDDWLSSKHIKMMDPYEECAYLHLLLRAASEPDCGLPDDDSQLALLSGLGPQWFKPTKDRAKRIGNKTSGEKIRECWFSRDGRIYNERLLKEWGHQQEVAAKRSEAGKRGAIAKANAKQTDQQNATNDVWVSDSGSGSEEIEQKLPCSAVDTPPPSDAVDSGNRSTVSGSSVAPVAFGSTVRRGPHVLDDFPRFREVAESVGMNGSEQDWRDASMLWRPMSFEHKLAAVKGLQDRDGTDDPALNALPVNYIRQQMWERKIRARSTFGKSRGDPFELAQ